jgi:hypothetical protein
MVLMRLVDLREIKLKGGFSNLRNGGLIIFNFNEMLLVINSRRLRKVWYQALIVKLRE